MTGTFLGLDNGLRVHLLEIPGLPLVNFHVVVGSGSSHDPVGKEGLSDFVCDMLRKGTSRRTAPQIADEIDYLGAEVDADTDLDSSHVTAEFLSRDLQTGLALLAETLIEPAFSPDEVDRLREEKLSDLRAIRDNPSALASRRLIEVLFEGHPYGHPRTGWERTVSTIGRDDVAVYDASLSEWANDPALPMERG